MGPFSIEPPALSSELARAASQITLQVADITRETTQAIVNAANSHMRHGGGVARAINTAAGPAYANQSAALAQREPVSAGAAIITEAGELPAEYVISAVGPIWGEHGGAEPQLLASAYVASLRLAAAWGISSISFPAISCGIYRYPPQQAAETSLRAVCVELAESSQDTRVRFCFLSGAESPMVDFERELELIRAA